MDEIKPKNSEAATTPNPPEKPRRAWTGIILVLAVLAVAGTFVFNIGKLPGISGATQSAAKKPKYHCPMHPSVVSDKPGACPICGMDLVPIEEGGKAAAADQAAPKSDVARLSVVSIAPETRKVMGLKLGVVEKSKIAREVRTSARVVADETRLWRVTPKTEGWVDQLFVSYAGQEVRKGDPLLIIYSPSLVSAEAEYLTALKARGTGGSNALVESARKRLELWDISDAQIEQLTRTGKAEKYLTLYAPASGVVITRDVLAGQKIASGDSLMVIADLSVVWADADIYQSDLPYVKVGMPLELSLPYWPGKLFEGKVIFVSPTLDPESRTLRARLEIPNNEMLLKPGMYGDARLLYELGERLTIPASAVMFGGLRAYAFRDHGDGHLVPTQIKLGIRSGDSYELLDGLKEGDRVVVSANFLVDSESNLKAAMAALAPDSPTGEMAGQPEDLSVGDYEKVLAAYLKIHEALAADNLANARKAAESLGGIALPSAAQIATAKGLAEARQQFRALSIAVIAAAQKYGAPANEKLSLLHCPMAFDSKGADWVQRTGETANPYFGKEMLGCGEERGPLTPPSPAHAH